MELSGIIKGLGMAEDSVILFFVFADLEKNRMFWYDAIVE